MMMISLLVSWSRICFVMGPATGGSLRSPWMRRSRPVIFMSFPFVQRYVSVTRPNGGSRTGCGDVACAPLTRSAQVSHDTHNNTYNFKFTFSVEIVPLCKVRVRRAAAATRKPVLARPLACPPS
jgi:hypothetical protein